MFGKVSLLGLLCAATQCSATTASEQCCKDLAAALPGKVSYADASAYQQSVSSYWALQEQLVTPECVLSPTKASEVSEALKVLVPKSCKFAVRGGGHGTPVEVANIQGGVTIDLRGINSLSLSKDKTQVSIGGAALLGDIYTYLAKFNLSVPCARAAGIGVGGSTLGGGIGYFAPSEGLAANSVTEYEVVLANGEIVIANKNKNSQLWRALKGGGSNFGIVTRLTFKTFALGDVWAGNVMFPGSDSTVQDTAKALFDFSSNPNYDTDASVFVLFGFSGIPLVLVEYTYTAPDANAPVFNGFKSIQGELSNTTGVTTIPMLSTTSQQQSPNGFQQITFAMTFVSNEEMIRETYDIMLAASAGLSGIKGGSIGLTLRPIVPSMLGTDDILGLQVPAEGLILNIGSAQFDLPQDYQTVKGVMDKLLSDLNAAAQKRGVLNRYIDMNHASTEQKVLAGYGPDNLAFLKRTASKYDPTCVFQTLMPGGFKL